MVYLRQTGRDEAKVKFIEDYLKAQGLFRMYDGSQKDPHFSGPIMELDLSTVKPSLAGPKRPHDKVDMDNMKKDFNDSLVNPVGFKGYGIPADNLKASASFTYTDGKQYTLKHGSVVIAAITSCTNTSNPDVMLAAGMVAQNAIKKGLNVLPYVKTSLSPGSGVVTQYLHESGLTPYLDQLGFTLAGYGCMTCIGNSGDLHESISEAIQKDLVVASVLSGNRNFEGRVHPLTRANYLASPPLVVAYALAGTVDIDFQTEPIGTGSDGNPVFLKDIWPTREEVQKVTNSVVKPAMFRDIYEKIAKGTERWNNLKAPEGKLYSWDEKSTYIHDPPFFKSMGKELPPRKQIKDAHCLALFGDSITTDHISPAGNIAKNSPAAKYLTERGIAPKDFNSYGARRGNDEIMARGTFANVRLVNQMMDKTGPQTLHVPSGEVMDIFDAADRYMKEGKQLIIIAGQEYGSGSSRDWAAKGPYLQGVTAVIAESFERIHRSNLLGMGIMPLQFRAGETAKTLGLKGTETYTISSPDELKVGTEVEVTASTGQKFICKMRLDTDPEISYYKNGGILPYVLRKLLA